MPIQQGYWENHVLLCISFLLNWKQKVCWQCLAKFCIYTLIQLKLNTMNWPNARNLWNIWCHIYGINSGLSAFWTSIWIFVPKDWWQNCACTWANTALTLWTTSALLLSVSWLISSESSQRLLLLRIVSKRSSYPT